MMLHKPAEASQGVCPDRWHIPSDGEWMVMERFLGMQPSDINILGAYRGDNNEGGMLKSTDKIWSSPNEGAVDTYQFSALPSGMVWNDGSSKSMGDFTVFWTTTLLDGSAIYRELHAFETGIGRFKGDPTNTTPVRCVKD